MPPDESPSAFSSSSSAAAAPAKREHSSDDELHDAEYWSRQAAKVARAAPVRRDLYLDTVSFDACWTHG